MAILFFFEDTPSLKINKNLLKSQLREISKIESHKIKDLNYIFCSDNYILNINNQYLNHNYFTDIITFDYCIENEINGDIFISIDTVKSNSEKFKTSFNQELYRVIFHGLLHLLKYNDKSDEEKRIMTSKEDEYLKLFQIID